MDNLISYTLSRWICTFSFRDGLDSTFPANSKRSNSTRCEPVVGLRLPERSPAAPLAVAAVRVLRDDPLALAGDVARGPEPEGVVGRAAGVVALAPGGPDEAEGRVCKRSGEGKAFGHEVGPWKSKVETPNFLNERKLSEYF